MFKVEVKLWRKIRDIIQKLIYTLTFIINFQELNRICLMSFYHVQKKKSNAEALKLAVAIKTGSFRHEKRGSVCRNTPVLQVALV